MTPQDLAHLATTFVVGKDDYSGRPMVTIEYRSDDHWVVCWGGGTVLARNGDWLHEPLPSSRTDKFKQRTRFPFAEAVERARAKLNTMPDTIKSQLP